MRRKLEYLQAIYFCNGRDAAQITCNNNTPGMRYISALGRRFLLCLACFALDKLDHSMRAHVLIRFVENNVMMAMLFSGAGRTHNCAASLVPRVVGKP